MKSFTGGLHGLLPGIYDVSIIVGDPLYPRSLKRNFTVCFITCDYIG